MTALDSSVGEKRERLVGLDLGEILSERLCSPWALELGWDLDKKGGDLCQDFEMAENVTYSWKGRGSNCPS